MKHDAAIVLLDFGDKALALGEAVSAPRLAVVTRVARGGIGALVQHPVVLAALVDEMPVVAIMADVDDAIELERRVARAAACGLEALLWPSDGPLPDVAAEAMTH